MNARREPRREPAPQNTPSVVSITEEQPVKEQPVVIAAEVIAQLSEPVAEPVPEPAVESAVEPSVEPEPIVVEEHIEVQSLPQTAVEPKSVAVVQTEVVETAVQPEPQPEKEEPVAEKVEERPAPQRQTRRVVRKVQRKKQPFEFSLGAFASSSVDAPITFGITAETKTAEASAPASVMNPMMPVTPVTPVTPVNPVTAASTVSVPAAQPTSEGREEEEA